MSPTTTRKTAQAKRASAPVKASEPTQDEPAQDPAQGEPDPDYTEQSGDDPDTAPSEPDAAPSEEESGTSQDEGGETPTSAEETALPGETAKPTDRSGFPYQDDDVPPSTDPSLHTAADTTGTLGAKAPTAGSGDSGPGTQVTAPPELETAGTRPPARSVTDSAAPIEAPDAALQTQPALGYNTSTTNTVAANAAISTYPGEDHVALVDEDGGELDVDTIFNEPEGAQTFVTVKQRVLETFKYQGSEQLALRQLYVQGARVDRLTAERIKDAYRRTHQ